MIKNFKVKKLLSKSILALCIKKVIARDSTVKHLCRKSIANKTNIDNKVLVKPFPGASTKALKHCVRSELEKIDLVILSTTLNLSIHLKRSPMKLFH